MKKHYLTIGAALAMAVAIPAISMAQDDSGNGSSPSISPSPSPTAAAPTGAPQNIRDRIRQDYQEHMDNLRNNQGARNSLLEDRRMGSTSTSTMMSGRDRGQNGQSENNDEGSTSAESDGHGHGMLNQMRKDDFDRQLGNLVNELDRAISNLEQIRGRIYDRIQKATANGRDMTQAKILLVVADTRLAAAKSAVDSLAGLSASSTLIVTPSTGSTTGPTVDISRPRQLGAAAIQAVKAAQRALNAVVVAIAHNMGLRVDNDGNVIPPPPSPSPTPTPSPSPSPSVTASPSPTTSATPPPSPSPSPSPSATVFPTP